jgi:uncharacterized protein
MFRRIININKNNSLFLFGARSTGKTTLVKELFGNEGTVWIDMLKDDDEDIYARQPGMLSALIERQKPEWVVIDEVQKAPKLLDIVHLEIEKHKNIKFVLTGSSARKLKRGGADLLAGRAFTHNLYPLSFFELQDRFDLNEVLAFGTLPKIFEYQNVDDKREFLRTYAKTYLKEEIIAEQIIRKIEPFRDFLQISAQHNGEIINYSKIARDVGIDDKTVESYYQILEDTLVGLRLPSYNRSVRKRQREAPKFYFFDTGVKRALSQTLRTDLSKGTYEFGKAFEHWVVLEVFRLNDYKKLDYQMMYLRTKDGAEIDLIIERPGDSSLLVEIKSSDLVKEEDGKHLNNFIKNWPGRAEAHIWSNDPVEKKFGNILALPWYKGLKEAGL